MFAGEREGDKGWVRGYILSENRPRGVIINTLRSSSTARDKDKG